MMKSKSINQAQVTNVLVEKTPEEVREERKRHFSNDQLSKKQLPLIAEEVMLRFRDAKRQIFEIGRLLVEGKEIVGHGNFKNWIKGSFGDSISYQTANNFMNVYLRCAGNPEIVNHLGSSVIYRIGAPDFDKELRDYIMDNLDEVDGSRVNVKVITELNKQYKDGKLDLDSPVVGEILGFNKKKDQYDQYCDQLERNIAVLEKLFSVIKNAQQQISWPRLGDSKEILIPTEKVKKLQGILEEIAKIVYGLTPEYQEVEKEEIVPSLTIPDQDDD